MAIDSKHPLYSEFSSDWAKMRDTYRGERVIKNKGQEYLPATSGMIADGMTNATAPGAKAYEAYKTRASFPDLVSDAIEAMIGVMHRKPPTIELPGKMEPLLERATIKGESLAVLLRRINEEQLVSGRLGLLVDMPSTPVPGHELPYLAMYQAEAMINWDQGERTTNVIDSLNLVVLDESEYVRTDMFNWEMVNKYRLLMLGDPIVNEGPLGGVYSAGVFEQGATEFNEATMLIPSIRGTTLQKIPFTFINSKDVVPDPDDPALLGLANLVLTIYRGEADYRQSLFMQGQDTLVVIGDAEEKTYRTGANSSIGLPTGGDAKFIGVDSQGLVEMRSALENDYSRAAQKGGQLLDSVSREKESGDALKVRVAARTSTLNQVALAGAFGLQQALRDIALWTGSNPEEVIVTPNLDFVDDTMAGKELIDLLTAKTLGAPLSQESIHLTMQTRGMTEKTLDEEVAAIEAEVPLAGSTAADDLDDEEDDFSDDQGNEDEDQGDE
jgi:hypothetical protein